MEFISKNKISEELLNFFDKKMTPEIILRLEDDSYELPFDDFKNCDLLRPASAISRSKSTFDCIHLVNQELLNEN